MPPIILGHNILSWWFSGFTFTVDTIHHDHLTTILKLDSFLLSINPENNGFSCILSKFWIIHHMYHLIQTSPSAILITHKRQLTQTRQPSLVTSNTARPANDNSKSNINMSKRGNLTGNKTTQQTKEIDTNSTENQEITSEETKNLLQK